jgi:DNA-binding winged helix-turn-helix (wHTH) protein
VEGRKPVLPRRRELLADDRPVKLGGRDFDVLMVLIEATGAVISKDELMSRVWAGRIVEENTRQGAISALRKAFGADRDLIRTVAGRGYQFTGEIRARSAGVPGAASAAAEPPRQQTFSSRFPNSSAARRRRGRAKQRRLPSSRRSSCPTSRRSRCCRFRT